MPKLFVTAYYYLKYRCFVSPRAEVELTPKLTLGRGTLISSFTKIKAADGPLSVGRNCSIATGCSFSAGPGGLHIGDDTLVGPNVAIVAGNFRYDRLDTPIRLQGVTSRGITIGSDVWIGANSSILDGARIGDGAILSANSVVSGTVPPNAIVSGNPARTVFTRR